MVAPPSLRRPPAAEAQDAFRFGGVVVCGALFVLAGCGPGAAGGQARQPSAVPVVTAVVDRRPVPIELQAIGTAEPVASIAIVSRVDGAIARVLVEDGQEVPRDGILFQIDPSAYEIALRSAKATLDRDLAQLGNAQAREERGRAVFEQHFISQDALTQLEADRASAAATVEADRAAVDKAALDLGYTTIRAPIAGKIGHVAFQPGNVVRATSPTPLATLNVLSPIDVAFSVPEQYVGAVRSALDGGKVAVHAQPDDSDEGAPGEDGQLTSIDNTIDTGTGEIRLRARFANAKRSLWPGQFVVVSFSVGLDRAATTVPAPAIVHGPAGTFLFAVKADNTVEQHDVVVVRSAGNDVVVTGIEPGGRVVVDGQSRLVPGALVTEANAGASSEPAAAR